MFKCCQGCSKRCIKNDGGKLISCHSYCKEYKEAKDKHDKEVLITKNIKETERLGWRCY